MAVSDTLPVAAMALLTVKPCVAVAVNAPLVTAPKINPVVFASAICTVLPVKATSARPKLLAALVKVMALVPALNVLAPVIATAPVCVMPLPLMSTVPLAVRLPKINPVALLSVIAIVPPAELRA